MKRAIIISFLILICIKTSYTQAEIGVEMGHHMSEYLWQSKRSSQFISYTNPGTKVGLFLEKHITNSLNIRTSIFYNFRYHDIAIGHLLISYTSHCLSLPIKGIWKVGKVVHLGLGADPTVLFAGMVEKTQFHIGICGELTFRIKENYRISAYCNYDFVPIELATLPKSNNVIGGVSFAYVLKKIKKRNIIYSPG